VSAKLRSVITTIQAPTPAVIELAERLQPLAATLLIIGDRKGPSAYPTEGTRFLSLADQLETEFSLARLLPTGHYSRKNVGYLVAIADGAECLYETDDDNAPLSSWRPREAMTSAGNIDAPGWCNVYRCFSEDRIWPRGMPLDALAVSFASRPHAAAVSSERSAIQQGLANGSPDVDAVWRLVLDRPFDFDEAPSVRLAPGTWCPFNSQSTWWWPEAFPLLYLPSYCSFRMTDIWRSFIAQRCLWELGQGVVFHAAEVQQERNEHDLMRDFNDEVPGYQRNRELVKLLEGLRLRAGTEAVVENLRACYDALISAGFFDSREGELVAAWCEGLEKPQA
jgi:hypothetical protein